MPRNPEPTCRNGHPKTPENSYARPDGKANECRVCRRAAQRRYELSDKGRDYVNGWHRDYYATRDHLTHGRRQLQIRRWNALHRLAKRHEAVA